MASQDNVEYIYKISPTPAPEPIPAIYPPSELDQTDGFIHLSTASQAPRTADMFFADATVLWFVKIKVHGLLHQRIDWGPTGCVSLYGQFGVADVTTVEKCQREGHKTWAECLQNEKWLE